MIPVLENKNFDSPSEFVKELNKARLANRGKWIVYSGIVKGKTVAIKTYDHTYLQIFRVNGINHGGSMDKPVGVWKKTIEEALN